MTPEQEKTMNINKDERISQLQQEMDDAITEFVHTNAAFNQSAAIITMVRYPDLNPDNDNQADDFEDMVSTAKLEALNNYLDVNSTFDSPTSFEDVNAFCETVNQIDKFKLY